MSKHLSSKYYQENKFRLLKKFVKNKKDNNTLENITRISHKIKKQVEYKKNIIEWEKTIYYNYKNVFRMYLENFASL